MTAIWEIGQLGANSVIILSIRWMFSRTPVVSVTRNSVADFDRSWEFSTYSSTWSRLWLTRSISHSAWNAAMRVLRLVLAWFVRVAVRMGF